MHHEISPQKAFSSDPPTTGSSGGPMGYRSKIASHQASCEPAILRWRQCHRCLFTAPASAMCERARPCHTTQVESPGSKTATSPALRCEPGEGRDALETPLGRCCHTDPAKHHPSSGTTEKG